MDSDPTKLTSFQPLTPDVSSSGFSISKIFDFRKRKQKAGNLPVTPEARRRGDIVPAVDVHISHAQSDSEIDHSCAQKHDGRDKKDNLYSWLTESMSSQSKVYGAKEKVPEVRLTQSETVAPQKEKWRYRNVRTILRRLSALTIDRRWHQTTGDFKHNFKQYWMPDEHCKECYECGMKFNTFRRRHHCRVCGQIFCYRCCSQEVPGKVIGFSGDIRVCCYCYKIVQAYLNDDLEKSIEALSEDIRAFDPSQPYELGGSSNSLSSIKSSLHFDDSFNRIRKSPSSNSLASVSNTERSPTPIQRSPFDAFGVAPNEANIIKQDYLRDLWRQITDSKRGIELSSHRYRLKTYHNCLVGQELNDWLVKYNKTANRADAVATGQALLDNGWIEPVYPTDDNTFKDEYMLYQPTKAAILFESQLTFNPFTNNDDMDLTDTERSHHKSTALLETETTSLCGTYTPTYTYDSSEESSLERKFSTLRDDDDDEEMPYWLKQLSNGNSEDQDNAIVTSSSLSNSSRRFSLGRHLDLDHVTMEENDGAKKADLSIQMSLDPSRLDDMKKEIYDPASKISFITHVPPPSLDTYVCVEGHQTATKKKLPKVNSSNSNLTEDILRGVVFPRPNAEPVSQCEDDISDDPTKDEGGERLARERLSYASKHHVRALLTQLLKQDNLLQTWEDIILPFISKVSEKVVPDVRRDDDMDIRRYVWITKVPGGLKTDCHFISGVVFRKHVSHKRMNGYFLQPKILMMSCAIEYQRNENKMSSLDPLVLQEYAFLQNFVKRVLALKPNILLVEKNVARVAQEMFLAGGITLIHNIKPQVMENIARCCGADILQTMEQVTRPRLGTCQQFRLQKYTLPKSIESKTLMYFEGCAPDLGCSLILRGGNEKTLIKVKKIIKYLIYVAYHLKLEEKFLMDEFAMPPELTKLTPQRKLSNSQIVRENVDLSDSAAEVTRLPPVTEGEANNPTFLIELMSESDKFADALKLINLSSSPFCSYSMPYLLTESGRLCPSRHFIAQKIYWSRYLDGSVNQPTVLKEDDHEWVENPDVVNPDIIVNDPHPFTDPSLLLDCMEDEEKRETLLNSFRARGGRLDLKMYRDYEEMQTRKIFGDAYDTVYGKHRDAVDAGSQTQMFDDVNVETQCVENLPDPKHDCFDAYNHQKIAVLFSSYSSESHNAPKPCISPWAVFMEFYGRNDITLGGFLERYCFRPSYICPSHNCDVPMVNHVRYFAHGQGSIYIHMRNLESPIPGYDRTILTWSWCKVCKQVCVKKEPRKTLTSKIRYVTFHRGKVLSKDVEVKIQVTPVVPLSFECWSMSFAKYLELRFYGNDYTRRASVEPCGHSLHHDHYQYFSFANMVASFKYRAIELYEVITPAYKISVGKQTNTKMVLDEVEEVNAKVETVTTLIMQRVSALKSEENIYSSASRGAIINEFVSELKRQQGNMNDCVQVINQKVALFSKKNTTKQQLHSSATSSSSSLTKSSESSSKASATTATDAGIPPTSSTASLTDDKTITQATTTQPQVVVVELSEEELYLLKIDIENKLFHLKKSMCESVENWNIKLQEFVAQDRKREKVIRSASPSKNITAEVTEFYPDVTDVNDTPKTITHMHPEPVSEVFLTDGTMIRQTYLGNTPSVSPYPGDSQNNSPAISRRISGDTVTTSDTGEVQSRKISGADGVQGADKKALSALELNKESTGTPTEQDPKRNQVGSPYMVIQSPFHNKSPEKEGVGSEVNSSEQQQDTESVLDQESDKAIDEWMSRLHTSMKQHDKTSADVSDSEMSLNVECNSDQDDLLSETDENTSQQGCLPDDSEGTSEVELAEEENDDEDNDDRDGIKVGQSAVDFVDQTNTTLQNSIEGEITDKKSKKDKNENSVRKSSRGLSFSKLRNASFTEFPKVKEEKHEKIEYLTPKEVKAMQVARRRRTEWENRVLKNIPKKKKDDKVALGEPLDFESDHFGFIPPTEETSTRNKTSSFSRSTSYKSQVSKTESVNKGSKTKTAAKASTSKIPTAKTNSNKSKVSSTKSMPSKPSTSKSTSQHASVKPRKSNPLIKRLVQNTFDATEGFKKKSLKKQESVKVSSTFKPILGENITDGSHPLNDADFDDNDVDEDLIDNGRKTTSPVRPTPILSFQQRKQLGHRRMKSAPLRTTKQRLQTEVPSELTPQSPFVFVQKQNQQNDEMRSRSRSMVNRGVKELNKMAEIVCNEDRIDAERDDLEVLQCETNSGQEKPIALQRKNSSQTLATEDKTLVNDDIINKRKSDTDTPDGKLVVSGEVAIPNSKRGGSEKMKKIISQFLPQTHFQAIPRPFPPSEQYMAQVNGTSCIVINEKEPTSLIAFTLSSLEYQQQLQTIQDLMAGKKVTNTFLQPSSTNSLLLTSQPNTPSPTRKQQTNIESQQQSITLQQRPSANSPIAPSLYVAFHRRKLLSKSKDVDVKIQKPQVNMRSTATSTSSRPRSWAGTTEVTASIEEDVFHSGPEELQRDSPALRRISGVGRRHPLASVELDPIADALLDNDDSVSNTDDMLDGSGSVKSGSVLGDDMKKKEDKIIIDHHIKLQFENNVAKFYCSAYYAEQFRQLRELIFPEGEERHYSGEAYLTIRMKKERLNTLTSKFRFIQSLTRCMFWKASGGKSGSSFSKSLDDRFVIKQMSRFEMQSFFDFAPRYFAYIRKAVKENWPTAMAKLLGVYRIGFKNSVTNTTMRQDVLVMENLFYEKKVNKIFDLKGSVRSRYVQKTTNNDVLMDENLLEMICESPLFIRAHSKAVLSKAVYNDTEFLSTNMVMDYSLLVGIDETKSELIVGIIDYIRTYTWDKKLESYVKSTGILGGQGKMPTVVSPEVYRTRFTEAMQRYFLMVPDKWTGFGADLS